jgi:ferredoxin
MAIITDEQAAKLREANIAVPYVNETCIGCSACVAISGDVFELNDEGKSEVVELGNYQDKDVDDAIMACPVDAISWRD